MKIIVVAAQKGGSGKTTLTRSLAVAASQEGRRVLMLDLDPQQSLREWWQGREGEAPVMLDADPPPGRLGATLDAVRPRFDVVLVDTPPSVSPWLADVLALADLVLVPVRPSPDDVRAARGTLALLASTGRPFAFVLSQATTRARLTEDVAQALARHGRVAPSTLGARVAYAESAGTGQGVTETGDPRAAQEVRDLWAYVQEQLA